MPLPDEGQTLEGKYRIERLIGRGGMGAVFQARHEVLNQPVAIKFLLPEVSASPSAVARFLNEARAAAQIHNDHVARVLDVVQPPGGGAFMVLEFLDGLDLATLVANQGPLPVAESVGYLLQCLEAIAQAHALGIVHRDLKPANLFLAHRPDGTTCVKVLDFGISKSGPGSTSLTATNAMLGSPSFMSPEQVRSPKSVDARSDLWSAGVCLYHLLTKELPYKGDTAGEVFAAILEQIPLPPRYLVPSIPPELEAVIMKCLQQHAEDRFADAGLLAAALAPFAAESDRGAVDRIRHTLSGSVRMPLPLSVQAPGGADTTSTPVRLTNSPPPALPVYRRLSKPDLSKQEAYQVEKTCAPPASLPAAEPAPAPLPAQLGDEAPTSRTDVRRREQAAATAAAQPSAPAPFPSPAPALVASTPAAAAPAAPAPEPAPATAALAETPPSPAPVLMPEIAGAATEPAYPAFKCPQPLDLGKQGDEAGNEEHEADTEQMESPFAPRLKLSPAKRPSAPAKAPASPAPVKSLADADDETDLSENDGKPTERLDTNHDLASLAAIEDEPTAVKPPAAEARSEVARLEAARGGASEKVMTILGVVFLLVALALGGYLVYARVIVTGSAKPAAEQPARAPAPE
ncbi:MAG TPA: serine/threonine-protein kinase [Myxococcales bacterium]